MNVIDFLQAMEQIDDKYIEEANKKVEKKHIKFAWKPYYNIAALVAICVIAAVAVKTLPRNSVDTAAPAQVEYFAEEEAQMCSPEACLEAAKIEEDVESAMSDYPALIMINGVLYCDSGEISTDGRCGVMDGEITSTCDEIPTTDNQSNFGTGYSYQIFENRIDVLIDEQWHIFVPY